MMTRSLALLVAASVLSACDRGTPYQWKLPPGFPEPIVPQDNPLTLEKIELGRRLFFDTRLSANQTQSCASCHQPERAFSDGKITAVGSTGQQHRRNSMGLANVAFNATYTWAHSGITTLEQHIVLPLFGETPVEMGVAGHEAEILLRLKNDTDYPALFAKAFPWQRHRIDFDHVAKAVASYVRTLTSFNAPFDRYAYYGEDAALTPSQLRGMNLFMSERLECSHCHNGFNFSQFVTHESNAVQDRSFHNTGLYYVNKDAEGFDYGLFGVTTDVGDKYKFKAPTLRNIEQTAPYMHDGSIATLGEVIDFYSAGGRQIAHGPFAGDGRLNPSKSAFVKGFVLTAEERQDLLNFLRSLTDKTFGK
jgi:cytochrome c peroxidase